METRKIKEWNGLIAMPMGRATGILLGLAALQILIVLVATNGSYGYDGDEFYYLACSEHLAWGYERENGGRGFGFSGGHFQWNWAQDDYRTLVWARKVGKVTSPSG